MCKFLSTIQININIFRLCINAHVEEMTGVGISLIYKSTGAHIHNLDKTDQKCDAIQCDRNTDMQCNILQVLHMQRPPITNQKAKMFIHTATVYQTF